MRERRERGVHSNTKHGAFQSQSNVTFGDDEDDDDCGMWKGLQSYADDDDDDRRAGQSSGVSYTYILS